MKPLKASSENKFKNTKEKIMSAEKNIEKAEQNVVENHFKENFIMN